VPGGAATPRPPTLARRVLHRLCLLSSSPSALHLSRHRCCCVHRAGTASPLFWCCCCDLRFLPPSFIIALRPRPVAPLGPAFLYSHCPFTPRTIASVLPPCDSPRRRRRDEPRFRPRASGDTFRTCLVATCARAQLSSLSVSRPSALPTIHWCLFTYSSRQRLSFATVHQQQQHERTTFTFVTYTGTDFRCKHGGRNASSPIPHPSTTAIPRTGCQPDDATTSSIIRRDAGSSQCKCSTAAAEVDADPAAEEPKTPASHPGSADDPRS
jgi:hypothetical protein